MQSLGLKAHNFSNQFFLSSAITVNVLCHDPCSSIMSHIFDHPIWILKYFIFIISLRRLQIYFPLVHISSDKQVSQPIFFLLHTYPYFRFAICALSKVSTLNV